jgi:chromate reductase
MAASTPLKILAVSGSLRQASTSSRLLQAARALAPEGVSLSLYGGLAELPAFNPDVEKAGSPPAVQAWRDQLKDCGAVLFATPEYAHGIPGALKNALDWVVGTGELVGKPVGVITASRSVFALAQLTEVLTVMSARMVPTAVLTLDHLKPDAPLDETTKLLVQDVLETIAVKVQPERI